MIAPALLVLTLAAAAPLVPPVLVVGARSPGGPPVSSAVAALRDAIARQGTLGPVLSEAAAQERLGVPSATPAWIRERIDAAELYYFQLELQPARKNLEDALGAMEHAGGDAAARDRARVARLLLGMVRMAEGGPGAREAARGELEKVARVEADFQPDPRTYPPEIVQLWDQARAAVTASPRGILRVRCLGPCQHAQVWVDAVPRGVPGEPIELAGGSYQVVVTDAFENPLLRSPARPAEVHAGTETAMDVDLARDAVDAAGGPALLTGEGAPAVEAAARLSRLGPAVVAWEEREGGSLWLHAARAAEGRPVAEGRVEVAGSEAAAAADLASFLAGAEVPSVHAGAPVAAAVTAAPSGRSSSLTVAGWATVGGAVILGGIGTYLVLDGNARAASINRQTVATPAVADPSGLHGEIGSITTEQTAGAVLLGVGAAAAASAVGMLVAARIE